MRVLFNIYMVTLEILTNEEGTCLIAVILPAPRIRLSVSLQTAVFNAVIEVAATHNSSAIVFKTTSRVTVDTNGF